MNWHYAEQGQQVGPVNDEQLAELVRLGKITADTLVWHEGMADWLPYGRIKSELTNSEAIPAPLETSPSPTGAATANTTEAVCSECGNVFPIDEMIRHGNARICAGCKPVFMQKLSEGAKIETGMFHYAGFWIRVGAKIVDGLILGVVLFVPLFIFGFHSAVAKPNREISPLFPLIIQLVYYPIMIAYDIFFIGKYGATPGKMACKIKVITADGGRVSYPRATGRAFAEKLSGLICYIGYIIVGFDKEKRALHDHICSTRVIYK